MSESQDPATIDMIRWTFAVEPEHREAITNYLTDLGLDVFVEGDGRVHASWDEPDRDMDDVAGELWALHGGPFEIMQEEFHRVSLMLLEHDEAASV